MCLGSHKPSDNGSTRRELGFDDDVLDALTGLGHTFREPLFPGIVGNAIGSVQAVVLDRPEKSASQPEKLFGARSVLLTNAGLVVLFRYAARRSIHAFIQTDIRHVASVILIS